MKTRLKAYREQTAPILPYYSAQNRLKAVDGMSSMEDVHNAIEDILRGTQA
jgi:adenylate kinase